jgi:hypothetical protein
MAALLFCPLSEHFFCSIPFSDSSPVSDAH